MIVRVEIVALSNTLKNEAPPPQVYQHIEIVEIVEIVETAETTETAETVETVETEMLLLVVEDLQEGKRFAAIIYVESALEGPYVHTCTQITLYLFAEITSKACAIAVTPARTITC